MFEFFVCVKCVCVGGGGGVRYMRRLNNKNLAHRYSIWITEELSGLCAIFGVSMRNMWGKLSLEWGKDGCRTKLWERPFIKNRIGCFDKWMKICGIHVITWTCNESTKEKVYKTPLRRPCVQFFLSTIPWIRIRHPHTKHRKYHMEVK